MARIIWDVSVSLDGFTTGPDVGPEAPMGDGGEALHHWLDATDPVDRDQIDAINSGLGASIVGRRTFDLGLPFWGGTPWPGIACLVVTHRPREGFAGANGGRFTFCPLRQAAQEARGVAGAGNINILGAAVAQQLLRAGEIDFIRLHTVPILLGGGTPMFRGERARLVPEGEPVKGTVLHQMFRVMRD